MRIGLSLLLLAGISGCARAPGDKAEIDWGSMEYSHASCPPGTLHCELESIDVKRGGSHSDHGQRAGGAKR